MNITDYYQSYKKYFWVWEEDGNVLAIAGGSTIAFKEQIGEILIGIAENGLPPFGALLLAMIATNKTMDNGVETVAALMQKNVEDRTTTQYATIDEAFSFLRMLQTMPQEYTIGKRRHILLQTIFADSHNKLNIPTSKGIATGLKNNERIKASIITQKEPNTAVFYKEVRCIALLLRRFPTVESIIDAMGDMPELSDAEIPLLEHPSLPQKIHKDFVEELIDNVKTFHAGALIKPIWAGFKVPIYNSHPSEQPLGGVSDLTNKGDFAKLLISEFANDDLIFMHRIANNEALYIQREMPPVKDKLHRTILIDISLKCWGTPKILAHAVYIAITRHPKSISETSAFVVGNHYMPVSCNTVEEIIDGLQQVDAGLHAAKGLTAFLEANKQDKQLELFFITTTDAILHPAVQKLLNDHHLLFKYIITTTAEGEINFYRKTNNVQKHLQTIRLPLQKLWTKKSIKENKEQKSTSPIVPQDFVPVLLPTPMQIRKSIPLEEDVYIVANRCLYKRTIEQNKKNNRGWQLLLRNVPSNGYYELGKTKTGETQFLSFAQQSKELCITNLQTLKNGKMQFAHWSVKRYPQFLFNKDHQFIYLIKHPHFFSLEGDFDKGNIIEQRLTSGINEIDYPKRQKEITDLPSIFSTSILKNINEVFINESNYLVLNTHQISINNNGISFFSSSNYLKVAETIKDSKTGVFSFKDGSKIIIDQCGVIKLVSSNHDIPDIFIIPVIDSSPAMATATQFAGNEFYYNQHLAEVTVTIEDTGTNRLMSIKIVKQYTELGLKEAQEIVHAAPHIIPGKMNINDAVKMIEELKNIGCIATMTNPKYQPQNIVSPEAFYLQNIATFIGHIINYAPKN